MVNYGVSGKIVKQFDDQFASYSGLPVIELIETPEYIWEEDNLLTIGAGAFGCNNKSEYKYRADLITVVSTNPNLKPVKKEYLVKPLLV